MKPWGEKPELPPARTPTTIRCNDRSKCLKCGHPAHREPFIRRYLEEDDEMRVLCPQCLHLWFELPLDRSET